MIVINREKGNHTEASILPSRAMLKLSNCFYTMTFVQKPFYVRCVKPNDIKSSTTFDDKRVGHQVRGNVIAKRFGGVQAKKCYRVNIPTFLFCFVLVFCFFLGFLFSRPFCSQRRTMFDFPRILLPCGFILCIFPHTWKSFFIGSWHGWRKPVVLAFIILLISSTDRFCFSRWITLG